MASEKSEKELFREYMIKIGRSNDKKHMSEIGRKGHAQLVKNIVARAKGELPEEKKKQEA